jgi:hypothetical protein
VGRLGGSVGQKKKHWKDERAKEERGLVARGNAVPIPNHDLPFVSFLNLM